MGFLKGGTADKLGNRYEGLWVVKQLLRLIAEAIQTVELEALGDDEAGVDLWILRNDGIREAHQCKAFNKGNHTWSIPDLTQRNVLEKACAQLTQDPTAEFRFVSAVTAPEMEDLSRSAREAGTSTKFISYFVNGPRETKFKSFCKSVSLDPASTQDQSEAFELLRRMEFHLFSGDSTTRTDLEFQASLLLEGQSPDSAVAALGEIAVDNLHKQLRAIDLGQLLEKYGLRPCLNAPNPGVVRRLQELQADFVDSIKPRLAGGKLISRPETQIICDILASNELRHAIVLHGAPGLGKSGILFELADRLIKDDTVLLAIRLDRQSPSTISAAAFGQQLGLPRSPVACLRDIAVGRSAVLILDQLDALRWTNAHAAQGLIVCKQILREVHAARSLGAKIELIFACRTFDLERDQEIKAWLNSDRSDLKIAKVESEELPPTTVRELVSQRGIDPESLWPSQLKLLQSIHLLAIWMEIVRTEHSAPRFDSSTQLMRRYWTNRRQKLEEAGCDPRRRDETIQSLVEYMEDNACLSAPERLLQNDERLKTELQSLGVINILSGEVSFGHQSNFDFLVADSAMSRMTLRNQNILDWLGPADRQSLFRREQLRQVLFLLADERHGQFIQTIELILRAQGVRFHLRQLSLEALGQVLPTTQSTDLVLRLLEQPQWYDHVRYHVLHGNKEYLTANHLRDQLLCRISSPEKETWQCAADWIFSVRKHAPDLVIAASGHTIEHTPEWVQRVAWLIGHDGTDVEADEVFELRVRCLREGASPNYVDWSKLSQENPTRAIQLFEAHIGNWIVRGAKWDRYRDDTHIYGNDSAPLAEVSKSHPQLTWELLWPRLVWFICNQPIRRREWLRQSGTTYWPTSERLVIPRTLGLCLLAAGRELAQTEPQRWLSQADRRLIQSSRFLTELFAQILRRVPTDWSDSIVNWLLKDSGRLRCAAGRKRPRWATAASLIRRFSPHCSKPLFDRLQQTLLRYHDPEEKRLASYWLEGTRHGIFDNRFGAAQYFLLAALPTTRRSAEATGRLGVLTEKFGSSPIERFTTESSLRSGFVVSSIDVERRFARMSNRAWLKLMTNKQLPSRRERWRIPPGGRSGFMQSNVEAMSRSLKRAALLDPERFAQLGLNIPHDVHPDFFTELLMAIRETNPPTEIPENERTAWAPATATSIDRLLAYLPNSEDPDFARAFCWVIVNRAELAITDSIIKRLEKYGKHSDPVSNALHVYCDQKASECSVEALHVNSINCVRGVAALAISKIVERRNDLLQQFMPSIEKLVSDEHPAVRVAAMQFCYSAWKEDEKLAVSWIVRASEDDGRIAATGNVVNLFNYAFPDHADALVPVIQGMLNSSYEEVVSAGASQVAARWLFFDYFCPEFSACLNGSAPQRVGVAKTFAQLVAEADYSDRCFAYVEQFMNDGEEKVRQQLSHIVYRDGFLEMPCAPRFIEKYISSAAGRDDSRSLLWQLKEYPGQLDRFADAIFAIADAICEYFTQRESGSENRFPDVDSAVHLLLRLYESASGQQADSIRKRCLDSWDMLLQRQATIAWSFTRGLENTQ